MQKFAFVVLAASAAFAQTPAAFEVASIKPAAEGQTSSGIKSDIGRIEGRNVTLKRCVRGAYNIPEAQILGGPKWVDDARYDIDAKAAGPAGDRELMAMLQQLLSERFKLAFHRETRQLPGYALVVGKKGVLAKPSEPGTPSVTSSSRRSIEATACNMGHLAMKISEVLHAPVTNATGIDGEFNFKVEWTPDELQTEFFLQLEEQLGLKLEVRRVPTEVLVIDSAQKPSEN
jgi:uncharacterized protein (TIGR03435 family)